MKFYDRHRSVVTHLMVPACTVTVAGGASFGSIFHGAQMVKMTQLGPGLESSFLGFLELKKCLGG